jgi:hypothetical protein
MVQRPVQIMRYGCRVITYSYARKVQRYSDDAKIIDIKVTGILFLDVCARRTASFVYKAVIRRALPYVSARARTLGLD